MIRVAFFARYRDSTMLRKLVELDSLPDITVEAVCPSNWTDDFVSTPHLAHPTDRLVLYSTPMLGAPTDPHRAVYRSLFGFMRRFRPHIVHVEEEPDSLAALQIALARAVWSPRAKLLLHTWQNVDRPLSAPVRAVLATTLRASDGVFCANQAAVDLLRRRGYRKPTWRIPAVGVDTTVFTPRPGPPSGPFTVGYVGRLVPEKGIDTLIDAVAKLTRADPATDLRLRIIGGGPLAAQLDAQAATAGIADRVEFVAGLPPQAVPAALGALHALVLPSRSTPVWQEQLGRVLLEAMAVGVPVIGAQSGAIPEVIGDAGLTFPEGDVTALRDCLTRLRQDPVLTRQLAAAGHRRVKQDYSQRVLALKTAAVYAQVLGKTVTSPDNYTDHP